MSRMLTPSCHISLISDAKRYQQTCPSKIKRCLNSRLQLYRLSSHLLNCWCCSHRCQSMIDWCHLQKLPKDHGHQNLHVNLHDPPRGPPVAMIHPLSFPSDSRDELGGPESQIASSPADSDASSKPFWRLSAPFQDAVDDRLNGEVPPDHQHKLLCHKKNSFGWQDDFPSEAVPIFCYLKLLKVNAKPRIHPLISGTQQLEPGPAAPSPSCFPPHSTGPSTSGFELAEVPRWFPAQQPSKTWIRCCGPNSPCLHHWCWSSCSPDLGCCDALQSHEPNWPWPLFQHCHSGNRRSHHPGLNLANSAQRCALQISLKARKNFAMHRNYPRMKPLPRESEKRAMASGSPLRVAVESERKCVYILFIQRTQWAESAEENVALSLP